MFLTAIEQRSR